MFHYNQVFLDDEHLNLDSEEEDDSEEIFKTLNYYLPLFEAEKSYYVDSYGIFLREKNSPFRLISFFKHFEENSYEIRSEILFDDDSRKEIFHFFGNRKNGIRVLKLVILGWDQMQGLLNRIKKIRSM
jgi:hypothetical protein